MVMLMTANRPGYRQITDGDSVDTAVEKAEVAELAVCRQLIDHYSAMATLAEWLTHRQVDSARVREVLVAGFMVGNSKPGIMPTTTRAAFEHAQSLVTHLTTSIEQGLVSRRLNLILLDPLLAKARAVVSEDNSLGRLRTNHTTVAAFIALVDDQSWGRDFFATSTTFWSSLR